MRRYVALLLVIILLLSSFSLAEDFTLRNGIVFGDSMEDILRKEKSLTRKSDTSDWFEGKIAGYNGAECGFYFDDNGKLISMDYSFGSSVCSSKTDVNNVYETIYDSLKRKYGAPLGNTGGSCYLITGPAIDRMSLYVYLFGSISGYNGDYYDYDEWIIEEDDYSIKIDLISYYYRNDDFDYYYFVDCSYHKFTDEDIRAERDQQQQKNDDIDADF